MQPAAQAVQPEGWTLVQPAQAKPQAALPSGLGVMGTAFELAKGFGKGAVSTIAHLGEMAGNAGMIPGARPNAFGAPEMRNPTFTRAEEATTATNTPQLIGKGLETLGELALPATRAIEAVPSVAKAGAKFQSVMGAARNMAVDITEPGNVALRIQQLADRGGSMPMAVRKFLGRITDPEKGPMTYEEARDFASNISRLSVNEFGRLTPVVAREVADMRVALNKAVAQTANRAGKGKEYADAMNEYAKAMKLKSAVNEAISGAKKAAPYMGGAGAAYWLTKKISSMLGDL